MTVCRWYYLWTLMIVLSLFGILPLHLTVAYSKKLRFISNRRHELTESHSVNASNEVFVDNIGIIKQPTKLEVLGLGSRSKRSDATLTITDPQWKNQWYLYRDPEPSLNVAAAWQVATGKGVIIGIVSDGINKEHEDLSVDKRLGYDFHQDVPKNINSLGTQAAGVVAASKNHLCGVGVAFDAKVSDIRVVEEHATERIRAKSMIKWLDGIDIYLHMWSWNRQIEDTELEMHPSVERALEMGTTQTNVANDIPSFLTQLETCLHGYFRPVDFPYARGRHGRGAIYVWDTRNSNQENSCAYDPYVNNRYTISITGITKSLDRLKSGTSCSAILATAYSQNNNSNDHIVTTSGDSTTSCTKEFGESSAAAAMVTGVLALALEANPNLTWRDVQHLIVYSSNSQLLKQRNPRDFIFNGASLLVSNAFGFGLIDAAKLVGMATVWKPVKPAKICNATSYHGIAGASITKSTIQVSPMACSLNYLEHVEVTFNLSYTNGRGNIQLTVESPSGTKTIIVPGRHNDDKVRSFNWTVLSVHFWGENPSGGWKLSLQAAPSTKFSAGTALIYGWSLKFHGLESHLDVPQTYPKLVPNLATRITQEEVVESGPKNTPLDFRSGEQTFLPWWFWLVVGSTCLCALIAVLVFAKQRFFKRRFRPGDEAKTEEEVESLHHDEHQQQQQQTTAA